MAADGKILIETELDTRSVKRGVKDVNSELDQIGKTMPKNSRRMVDQFGNELDSMGRRINRVYQGTSKEAQAMQREMQDAFRAQNMAMRGTRDEMIKIQHGYFKMAQGAKTYTGTSKQFMKDVDAMGAKHKKVMDDMMRNNELAKMGFIQGVGQMINMSTQASKISDNFTRMGNPLYSVNKGALAVADGLNKIALRGGPAVLALKMLGPTADMKKLNDMTMMIGQGLMRFQMIAIGAAVANVALFGGLHKAAMDSVKGYETAFNRMKKIVREAFQPMVDLFGQIMIPLFDMISAVGKMTIEFNKAHPVLAKVLQGIVMLVPVLTLLLSPLAIGIGLVAGFQAAFASLWMFIGPVITGMAAMSATVWIVAAAIVAGTAALVYFWKTNETFRNTVITAWQAIKDKAMEVFGWLANFIGPILSAALDRITTFASLMMTAIKQAFSGDFEGLFETFKQLIPTLIGFMIGGLPGLLIAGARFIPSIIEGIQSNSASFAETATNLINQFVQFITTQLPILIQQGVTILQNLVTGIVQALPILLGAVTQILNFIVTQITTLLPILISAGLEIITAILNAIVQNLPLLVEAAMQIITTLLNGIVTLLPQLLQAGLQILMALVDAIVTNLPLILNAALQIITTLIEGIMTLIPTLIPVALEIIMTIVNMIVENLPLILNAGIEILMMLIDGIVQMLPQLITTAVDLITQIANALAQNLPVIIEAGVQVLTSLIQGIIQMLPDLIAAFFEITSAMYQAIIDALPQLLEAGIQIITSLLDGIIQMKSAVNDGIIQIANSIIDTFSEIDLYSIGSDIVSGLISGVNSMADSAMETVRTLAKNIKDAATSFFDINSPSKVMADEVGAHLPTGVAMGITANTDKAVSAMKGLGNEMMMQTPRNFAKSMSKNGSIARPQAQSQTGMIHISNILDSRVLGEAVVPFVNNRQQQQASIKNMRQGGKM